MRKNRRTAKKRTVVALVVLAAYIYLLFRPDPNKKYVAIDRGEAVKSQS